MGRRIVYTHRSEVRLAKSDGSEARTLLTAPGSPSRPRWSPDGKRLRYSVQDAKTGASSPLGGESGRDLPPAIVARLERRAGRLLRYLDPGREVFSPSLREATSGPSATERGSCAGTIPNRCSSRSGPSASACPSRAGTGSASSPSVTSPRGSRSAMTPGRDSSFRTWPGSRSSTWWPRGTALGSPTPPSPKERSGVSVADGSERLQLTFPAPFCRDASLVPRRKGDRLFCGEPPGRAPGSTSCRRRGASLAGPRPATAPSGTRPGRPTAVGWPSGADRGAEASDSPNAVIHVLDLETRAVSTLPGSQGLFSPRFSPDGRHMAALCFDAQRLVLFEFATSKWTELYKGIVGWPNWSRDGRHLYLDTGTDVRLVRIDDRQRRAGH